MSKKQLVEVALPLEEINRPSSRVHPHKDDVPLPCTCGGRGSGGAFSPSSRGW